MRPIIFRAKRKDNGEWVEGDFVSNKYILQGYRVERGFVVPYNTFEVIPETVGQYTGLCDKNGKKIFEGDIIRWTTSTYYPTVIVEFFDGVFVIKDKGNHLRAPLYHYCHLVEVIGNVIDNPELLEDNQ